jgi:hypothetical protein
MRSDPIFESTTEVGERPKRDRQFVVTKTTAVLVFPRYGESIPNRARVDRGAHTCRLPGGGGVKDARGAESVRWPTPRFRLQESDLAGGTSPREVANSLD